MDANGSNPSPSPLFPSNSPNDAEEQATAPDSSILRRTTISVISEAPREMHRHLQEASAALDAAYNRMRQIRQSLLQLAESLPETHSQIRLQGPERDSGHADDAFLPPPRFQHISSDGQGRARTGTLWNQTLPSNRVFPESDSHSVDVRQMNLLQSVPWNGNRIVSSVRVTQANRDAPGDDGSTILGRRVAARLFTSPTVGDTTSATNQLIQDAGQIYERAYRSIVAVTRGYEEDLERVLRIVGERRRNSLPIPSRPARSRASTSAQTSSQSTSQLSPRQSSQRTTSRSSRSSPGSSLNPEWDLGPGSTFSNAQQNIWPWPSEGLSFLSNFSVQNPPILSTSNMPTRPLISGGPLSNISPETVDPISESRYHLTADPDSAIEGRNYVVRRRYNRNGEELVHNITVDWDEDDPMSWLMPSPNISRRHRNRFSSPRQNFDLLRASDTLATHLPQDTVAPFTSTAPSPALALNASESPDSGESAPRRRGWARLDPDGNEIPSDEEEEFERSRADSRIRATRRAQVLASIAQTAGMMLPIPSTPPPQELTIYQNLRPPVVLRHDPSLSYPADFVDPLPMPISEMVDSGKTTKRKPILLPRHAIMAGR